MPALEKDLQAFTDVYGNCEHATSKVTEGDLSDTVDATITQFAIPDTGADKQYAFLITYDVFDHKVNYVDVFMLKGTTAVTLEYNGIDQFDQVEMARLATAAINKLDDSRQRRLVELTRGRRPTPVSRGSDRGRGRTGGRAG